MIPLSSVAVPLRAVPVDREQVPGPALRRLHCRLRRGHGARPPARPDGGGAHQRRARHLGVLPAPQAEGGQASGNVLFDTVLNSKIRFSPDWRYRDSLEPGCEKCLPGPAWLLLSKTDPPFGSSL